MSCKFLSAYENGLVFQLVGKNCMSQCTSIVQVFLSAAPKHSKWLKKYTGALCFVKDSIKRSYYFRLYCLIRHEMMWEQEIYDSIKISKPRPYLLTFEGQHGMIAFNYAFDEEADVFLEMVTTIVTARNKKRLVKQQQPQSQSFKNNKKKFEIGTPSNVKHVMHVGFDGKQDFGLGPHNQKFISVASHLVGCQYLQKGATLPKRNQREPLPPLPLSSKKPPHNTLPSKGSPKQRTDVRRVRQPDSQTTVTDGKGGYIIKTVEKGKSKSNMSPAVPDISNLLKIALKAHCRQQSPSQRSGSSRTPDSSDSDEW